MIAAAQSDHIAAESVQERPALAGIHYFAQALTGQGVIGGDNGGQMVCDLALASLGELARLGQEEGSLGQDLLPEEPVAVGPLFPLGEVGLANRPGGKDGGQQGLDFRQGVEPGDDLFGGLAIAQTGVDLFAKQMRKAGDFTIVRAGHVLFWLYSLIFG
jgi:hypothetical protein